MGWVGVGFRRGRDGLEWTGQLSGLCCAVRKAAGRVGLVGEAKRATPSVTRVRVYGARERDIDEIEITKGQPHEVSISILIINQ